MKTTLHRKYLPALLAALALSACGSGGSKPTAMPQPNPKTAQPAPPVAKQPEEPPVAKQPEPPVAAPEQPNPQPPAQQEHMPETDAEVFKHLQLRTQNGIEGEDLMKLVLNDRDKKIELTLLNHENQFIKHEARTLRDSAGGLIGYYGYALVNKPLKNDFGEYDGSQQLYFGLLDADESKRQRPEGLEEISYRGNMLYRYRAAPAEILEADVSARYYGKEKTMSLNIHDRNGGLWTLHRERAANSSNRVAVDERGAVAGHLFFSGSDGGRREFNGTFNGGLYGRNGSVLTGHASHEGRNAWEGVVGAKAAQ
ncbi:MULTISPECIES: hypothetical protein [unclassified Neisseria]|uniref:hypothetical protein n=1 Tax=unclassified Neisseria TaxID=2623750 RepID=UPI001071AB68|nr:MULTISPECIES: hypothetical protein [unclassified Neisseria]MBF0803182.1 hypothetical protein [Neisseria sp. 19428wB4_WF04]TFU44156.1 hypothetical protein E4T99_02220 [Neisseria sp. WF04]